MGYLYGNSEPFPQGYDFVSALDSFLEGAVKGLALDGEARALAEELRAAREERARSLEAVDELHAAAGAALKALGPESAAGAAQDYLEGLTVHAAGLVDSIKKKTHSEGEVADRQVEGELINKRLELRATLGAFLALLKLPIEAATVEMRLASGRPELTAKVESPGGIGVAHTIDISALSEWHSVRKVLELTTGLRLPMDVKRGWLSGSMQQETIPVGDYLIGGFSLSRSEAVVRLKRKIGDSDAVVLHLSREGDVLSGTMRQPGSGAAEGERTAIAEAENAALAELFDKLWESCERALDHRGQLTGLFWGGEELKEGEAVPALVAQVVELIAGTLREVEQRSPNPAELSLKYEAEAGRRQEIYRTKRELAEKLATLSAEEQEIFEPLGLFRGEP